MLLVVSTASTVETESRINIDNFPDYTVTTPHRYITRFGTIKMNYFVINSYNYFSFK